MAKRGRPPKGREKTRVYDLDELPTVVSTNHVHKYQFDARRSELDEEYNHIRCRCGSGRLEHK